MWLMMLCCMELKVTAHPIASMFACPQAFYIDTDAELVRWVGTHPEYSPEAITALANSVADYRGLLKVKRAALLEKAAAMAAGSM